MLIVRDYDTGLTHLWWKLCLGFIFMKFSLRQSEHITAHSRRRQSQKNYNDIQEWCDDDERSLLIKFMLRWRKSLRKMMWYKLWLNENFFPVSFRKFFCFFPESEWVCDIRAFCFCLAREKLLNQFNSCDGNMAKCLWAIWIESGNYESSIFIWKKHKRAVSADSEHWIKASRLPLEHFDFTKMMGLYRNIKVSNIENLYVVTMTNQTGGGRDNKW